MGKRESVAPLQPDMRLLTNSCSGEWQQCPRKFKLRYVDGYVPVHTPEPLVFGTATHVCLEVYWLTRKANGKDPLGAALSAIPADFDPFDAARLRVMLHAYAAMWDRTWCEVVAVEIAFEVPLCDPVTNTPSVFWKRAGKIDLVLRDRSRNVVIVEHKTSGEEIGAGSDYNRRLLLDTQVSTYLDGARSIGLNPNRIIYDVLKKPNEKPLQATPIEERKYTKPTKKDPVSRLYSKQRENDETVDEYEERILAAVVEKPDEHVMRAVVHRFGHEMDAFQQDSWDQAEMMRESIEADRFPRFTKNCFRFGKPCSYLSVCEGRESIGNPMAFVKLKDVHPELGRNNV